MCGYFCFEFIDFMLKGKTLLDYTNLLSPNDYEKNDKIILKSFQLLSRWKNYITLFVVFIKKWDMTSSNYNYNSGVFKST